MADDGLLMNISLDSSVHLKPVFKGGRWRDRLSAKKSLQYRPGGIGREGLSPPVLRNTQSARTEAAKEYEIEDDDRPQKKQRTSRLGSGYKKIPAQSSVISSLFTYNPSATIEHSKNENMDSIPAAPSNAPLLDGLDTFTSLGLSTPLATHLLTKLNLKAPTAIQKAAIAQLLREDSDAFLQAETGSGKTLAYLLPVVQRVMMLSREGETDATGATGADRQIHRDSGLFAIILAPTRELCKQISVVLDSLLRCAHWIVSGSVIGGEKKKSEKARLRKGLNILVATPGRLIDHLSNTEALDVSKVRWLILDEGDRLMELGFEEDIKTIVSRLEEQSKASKVVTPGLPIRRTTILCSATMKMNVHRLGEISLQDAVHIKADHSSVAENVDAENEESRFSAPAQLKQSYVIIPAKQRLVTLAAVLKRTFARKGSVKKAIVFLSCADSVDFHFELFGRTPTNIDAKAEADALHTGAGEKTASTTKTALPTLTSAPLLASSSTANVSLYKLHGSLPQPLRTATLSSFSRTSEVAILLCTDVASRGLDVPNIDLVIEYDAAFSSDEHLHRIGRTARAGRNGRAMVFLMPGAEEGYIEILKRVHSDGLGSGLIAASAEEMLRKGFGVEEEKKQSGGWEERATEWQLEAERWVLEDTRAAEKARKAFISHVRAYATHVVAEREIFDVKSLHLGHLAKAFALRERPGKMGRGSSAANDHAVRESQAGHKRKTAKAGSMAKKADDEGVVAVTDRQEAARRMRKAMQAQMAGANEFNIG